MTLFLCIAAHLIFMFLAIVVSKMAENEDIIDHDDVELAIILSFFLPIGVLVVLGALWVGDKL